MALPDSLPAPHLTARRFGARRLLLLTDEALFECAGVRIAFTGREGGKSSGPYSSLNLGSHVDDDPAAVEANRAILLDALGAGDTRLIVPNQVHGDTIVRIDDTASAALDAACRRAADGADAVAVAVEGVAALLCFADCVPVIVVSPMALAVTLPLVKPTDTMFLSLEINLTTSVELPGWREAFSVKASYR